MTQEEINKAFEGRWRIKGNLGKINTNSATMSFDEFYDYIRDLCHDFFEAGIMIGQGSETETEKPKPFCEVHVSKRLPDGTMTPLEEVNPFEYWWKIYDFRVGRDKCEKKWAKLTEKEKAECIAATPAYVASTPDKQFRKRPLTYLNGKCWNDEIINRNGNSTNNDPKSKLADILAP